MPRNLDDVEGLSKERLAGKRRFAMSKKKFVNEEEREDGDLVEDSQVSQSVEEIDDGGISSSGGDFEAREGGGKIIKILYPTWRSQLVGLFWFFVTSALAVSLSKGSLSFLVVTNRLFSIGGTEVAFSLPLLTLLPGYFLGRILLTIYDSQYIIDDKGIEAQIGLVSLSLRQPRLRYEDIRGVEPTQTIVERLLGIGTLLVGSAMTFEVEIVMAGIASPREVQKLLNEQREKFLTRIGKSSSGEVDVISGD